jgi:glycosyltransferase involved in cell wall biosynthesis
MYCGRLASEKALAHLIEAFGLVAHNSPEAMVVLVGDGPVRPELERQVTQLGLHPSKIKFVGRVNPTEVCDWLKIADIFTLVSFSEGFACALAEAMSAGLPCVVSDIPANRQLIDNGKHGFLTPVGDAEAISGAIIQLLKNAGLRQRMGEAARQRIQDNYSTDKICDRYELLFREMLAEAKAKT